MTVIPEETKSKLYDKGWYSFNVPPVNHAKWGKVEWMKYIDTNGRWWVDHIKYLEV